MIRPAAIYARVSTADQSCDRQVSDLTEFARRCGYDVVGVFKETASGASAKRKVRQQIIDLAQARKIDAILVTELSRWGRSTRDLLGSMEQLGTWNVSVVAMQGLTFEPGTPHGRMMTTLLAGIAQFERDLLSERVKSGLAAARRRANGSGVRRGSAQYQTRSLRKSLRPSAKAGAIAGSPETLEPVKAPS